MASGRREGRAAYGAQGTRRESTVGLSICHLCSLGNPVAAALFNIEQLGHWLAIVIDGSDADERHLHFAPTEHGEKRVDDVRIELGARSAGDHLADLER